MIFTEANTAEIRPLASVAPGTGEGPRWNPA